MLWAAYDEQPELSRPSHYVEEWSEDPAYKACTADGFGSRYSHLYDVETSILKVIPQNTIAPISWLRGSPIGFTVRDL
jgi:hypothetical protein